MDGTHFPFSFFFFSSLSFLFFSFSCSFSFLCRQGTVGPPLTWKFSSFPVGGHAMIASQRRASPSTTIIRSDLREHFTTTTWDSSNSTIRVTPCGLPTALHSYSLDLWQVTAKLPIGVSLGFFSSTFFPFSFVALFSHCVIPCQGPTSEFGDKKSIRKLRRS